MNLKQIGQKFVRDAVVAVVGITLAIVINNWTGLIGGINDAIPGDSNDVSEAAAGVGFAAILGFYRLIRAAADQGPDIA